MQTFLPYPSFLQSAQCLDRLRLGKQRVEAKQILETLVEVAMFPDAKRAWAHHPAVRMWAGYEGALVDYGVEMCAEWRRRGYHDALLGFFSMYQTAMHGRDNPPWLGDERLHSSHRAALLAKDVEHYSQFKWEEEPVINYWWPTKQEET